MSKKSRGTTRDANRRRERHARRACGWRRDFGKWKKRQRHGGRVGAALGCVAGRDVILKFNGQEIEAVPASVLDWHTGPGVH